MSDSVVEHAKKIYDRTKAPYVVCGVKVDEWEKLPDIKKEEWIAAARRELDCLNTDPTPFSPLSSDILNQARSIVSGDRQTVNGKPERSFAQLSQMWSAYLGVPVTDVDCAQMLVLLKMVRAKSGVTKGDHFVDQAGYSALAGELAANGAP